jgi:hypothetical protein
MTTTHTIQEQPVEMLDAGSARPWPVRILTILLFIEAVGLIFLSIFSFSTTIVPQDDLLTAFVIFITAIPRSLAFGALGLLALVAGFGFLWLWRTGWPTAMMVQGLGLLVALGLYLRSGPPYVFAIMVYGIAMVIYLHHPDVQQAFQTKKMQETELEEAS